MMNHGIRERTPPAETAARSADAVGFQPGIWALESGRLNDGWLSPLQPEMKNYSLTSFWTKTEIHGGMWWVCSCWGSRRWAAKAPPGPIEVRWKVQLGSAEYIINIRSYFPVRMCIYIYVKIKDSVQHVTTCYDYIYWIHCNIYKLQHQTIYIKLDLVPKKTDNFWTKRWDSRRSTSLLEEHL